MLSYFMPKRWEMAVMLFCGALIVYTQRVAISVASQQMLAELNWSLGQKGLVLSAFYWGYTAGQLFAPAIVQAIGPKFVFALSVLLPSLTTLFVPAAARQSFGLLLFLLCLLGLFQSVTFPAIYQFIPHWIPLEEKTIMVPFIYSGCSLGNIVGYSVCSRVLKTSIFVAGRSLGGWDGCFYVFGLLGIVWLPYWLLCAYDTPSLHPRITKDELELINEGKHFPSAESLENMSSKLFSDPEGMSGMELVMRSPESHVSDEESGTMTVGATLHCSHLDPIDEDDTVDSDRITASVPKQLSQDQLPPSEAPSEPLTPVSETTDEQVLLPRKVSNSTQRDLTDVRVRFDSTESAAASVESVGKAVSTATPISTPIKSSFSRSYSNASPNDIPGSFRSRAGSAYRLSVKYPRYEDDDQEHEFSEPIALEDVAMNMFSTASSRVMRVDGRSSKRPGRPRTLTIVAHPKHRQTMSKETPWMNFFTHPVALTLLLNSWCSNWISYTLMSEMPAFLSDALGFDLSKAGMLCIFPYVALAIFSLSCGGIFEYLQNEHGLSTNAVRKSGNFIAFVLSSVFLVICGFMSDPYDAYIFMVFTQGLTGAVQVGLACAYSDIAPNFSSALNTLGNLVGSIAGISGPLVVAAVLQDYPGIWGWRIIFFITLAQALVGIVFWFVYQTSNPVPELNCPRSDHKGFYKID